jgi:hypothetical protein
MDIVDASTAGGAGRKLGRHAGRLKMAAAATLIGVLAGGAAMAPGIASASASGPAAAAAGKTRQIKCRGGSNSCKAVVSLAGGASRVKLVIALSDTNLKLKSVVAKPKSVKGAYELSGGKYSLGGSVYTVTLNAVQSIPKGSTLTLTFAAPKG